MEQSVIYLTANETCGIDEMKQPAPLSVISGVFHFIGAFGEVNFTLAQKAFASRIDSDFARLMTANASLTGRGAEHDPERAVHTLRKIADKNAFAAYNLAYCEEIGYGTKKLPKEAAVTYGKVLNYVPRAAYRLGLCRYYGVGVPRSLYMASANFETAAEKGHVKSMEMLAYMYEFGIGTEKNTDRALRLYNSRKGAGLSLPYGFFDDSELSDGLFIDRALGAIPCEPSTTEQLFFEYLRAKRERDSSALKAVLRKFTDIGFADAAHELACLMLDENDADAADILAKNVFINRHEGSFSLRRGTFWQNMEKNENVSPLREFYDMQAVILYSRMLPQSFDIYDTNAALTAEQNVMWFEYIVMRYFGHACEKNTALALSMARWCADNLTNRRLRELLCLLLLCEDENFRIPTNNVAHDCLKTIMCLTGAFTSPNAALNAARAVSDKAFGMYVRGRVHESMGQTHLAMLSYYEYLTADGGEAKDNVFGRSAATFCERLIEEKAVAFVTERFVPADKARLLSLRVGDYFYGRDTEMCGKAYLSLITGKNRAVDEGVDYELAVFSWYRTMFLFDGRLWGNIEYISEDAPGLFKDIFALYATASNCEQTVMTYLKGNEITAWIEQVFNNKDVTNKQAFDETRSKTFGDRHVEAFLSYPDWLLFDSDKDALYAQCLRYLNGDGVDKNEGLAISGNNVFMGLNGLAKEKHVGARLKIAEMCAASSDKAEIKRAEKVYSEFLDAENPAALLGMARLGEEGKVKLNGETVWRLGCAARMRGFGL